jgi:hypothetical protein
VNSNTNVPHDEDDHHHDQPRLTEHVHRPAGRPVDHAAGDAGGAAAPPLSSTYATAGAGAGIRACASEMCARARSTAHGVHAPTTTMMIIIGGGAELGNDRRRR